MVGAGQYLKHFLNNTNILSLSYPPPQVIINYALGLLFRQGLNTYYRVFLCRLEGKGEGKPAGTGSGAHRFQPPAYSGPAHRGCQYKTEDGFYGQRRPLA